MNWSIVANVILVILLILVVVLAVLYFLGRKMEKRQVEQQSAIDAAKQTVSLMAIDKKKLKIKEAGLPPIVYEQTPWYAKRMKVPVVKAKIGTKIMTMIADEKVFLQLPLKTEVRSARRTDPASEKENSRSAYQRNFQKRLNRQEQTKQKIRSRNGWTSHPMGGSFSICRLLPSPAFQTYRQQNTR